MAGQLRIRAGRWPAALPGGRIIPHYPASWSIGHFGTCGTAIWCIRNPTALSEIVGCRTGFEIPSRRYPDRISNTGTFLNVILRQGGGAVARTATCGRGAAPGPDPDNQIGGNRRRMILGRAGVMVDKNTGVQQTLGS
ncbi:hypothetical protein AL037_08005 [Salipiger aestuarii]|nr:hypothetical protein AL037_08005 [Salipiger aestuarii]